MYDQEPDLIREVIDVFHLSWPQILFVANHGAPTEALAAWRSQAEEEHEARQEELAVQSKRQGWGGQTRRPFEVTGQPVRFSKIKLFQFYRKYEKEIWDSAYAFITSTEGGDPSYFEALAKCVSSANIHSLASLNDIAVAAAKWAIGEACQIVFSDYDGNHDKEGEEDYSQFRDIWEPPPEHEDVHTDTGFHEESIDGAIMKRLKAN